MRAVGCGDRCVLWAAMGAAVGASIGGGWGGKRPCPAPGPLAPQPAIRIAIRNPYQKSAIRIRNPYRIFSSRAVTGHFLWPGLFAIRKIRTSVNPHRKSVIRIMNP
jgi:hypothetical protein